MLKPLYDIDRGVKYPCFDWAENPKKLIPYFKEYDRLLEEIVHGDGDLNNGFAFYANQISEALKMKPNVNWSAHIPKDYSYLLMGSN